MDKQTQRLAQATKQALSGNFTQALKSLTYGDDTFDGLVGGLTMGMPLEPAEYRGFDSSWVASIDGNGYNYFKYNDLKDASKAYAKCPPVTAVINRKASAFINGQSYVLDKNNKESDRKEAKNIRKLLLKPNPIQGWEDFEAQNYIYTQIFGYCPVLVIKPFGYKKNIDASSMWNIPPNISKITESDVLFYQNDLKSIISKLEIEYKGQHVELNLDDIIFIRDFTPNFNSMILPSSRIVSLEMPINNIIGAYESRNVLINYRGALGVISQDPGSGVAGALPMTKEQKEDLQKDFKRYGLKHKQIQFIITKAAIKWQQMGYPTKDLMLFEEIEADTMAICDNYGHPYRLLSNLSSNSLGGTDAQIFGKILYQDTIIPEAHRIYTQWDRAFGLDEYELHMNKDYSHIPVLQEDKVQVGQARYNLNQAYELEWKNGLVTRNQWRIANGDDPVNGDDVLIGDLPKGNQPLAVTIGVGGVTSLIGILTAQISGEAKQAALEVVFGLSPADAARMVVEDKPESPVVTTNEPPASPVAG